MVVRLSTPLTLTTSVTLPLGTPFRTNVPPGGTVVAMLVPAIVMVTPTAAPVLLDAVVAPLRVPAILAEPEPDVDGEDGADGIDPFSALPHARADTIATSSAPRTRVF